MNTFGIQERETTRTTKKRERERDLFLNPMPTFFVFLHSFSELSISLFPYL